MKRIELYTPWSLRGIELCAGSRFELSRSLARLVLSSTVTKVKVETLNETSGEYLILLKGILELNENKETGG